METEKDIMMYFHTALRNAGLYTSTSLALLGISRYYRNKNKIISLIFVVLTLFTLCVGFSLCFYLNSDFEEMVSSLKKPMYVDKWYFIPKLVLGIQICIAILCLYRVYFT